MFCREELFLHSRLVIHSVISLCLWNHEFLFFLWGKSNESFCCSNSSSFDHWDLLQVGSFDLLTCPHPFFKHILPLWFQVSLIHLVIYTPALNEPLVQGVLVPFIGKWCLETKVRVLVGLNATGLPLLLGPHHRLSWEINACIITHTHTSIFISASVFIYIKTISLYWYPDSSSAPQGLLY